MRHSFFILFALTCLNFGAAPGRADVAPVALVYNGPGICDVSCADAAADVARRSGFDVRWVAPTGLTADVFRGARVWLQPGGDAIEVAKSLSAEQKELIRSFVRGGGGYVGFCAGAFFADKTVDDEDKIEGLGIIPGSTADYTAGGHLGIFPVTWKNRVRHIYFEDGATFNVAPGAAEILARFADGAPAAIDARYGAGRVVVSGAHPEAPDSWKTSQLLYDEDGTDLDLAIDMLLRAVSLEIH